MAVQQNRLHKWLVGGPPLAYLVIFFAIPVLIMVLASFRNPGEFGGLAPLLNEESGSMQPDLTTENYHRFFSDFLYTRLFLKSIAYAAVTTFICLVIAYPLSMLIARSPKKHRDLLVLLVILPFWSNFLIRVYAWMIILGPQSVFVTTLNHIAGWFGIGPVSLLYTPFAVIVGLVYVHLPFMVLPLYSVMRGIPPTFVRAASSLGARPFTAFRRVYLPQTLPGIGAGCLMVFIQALGYYITPALVGGGDDQMISYFIAFYASRTVNWGMAAALSIMLLTATLALYAVYNRLIGVERMRLG